jgi:hypothetical protein
MTHEQAVSSMATERYLLDEMPELEREAFEEHYFSCGQCADDVRLAELMRRGARAGFAAAAAPRRTVRWSVAAPWAAAASLAVIVGYQALVAPGRQTPAGPQVLTPITLRPASRGADAVITVEASTPAVTLALDVDAPVGTALDYELRDAEGRTVAGGRASVQAAAAPLLLWMPTSVLDPPGRYELVLRDAAGSLMGEYRFTTASP